MDKQQTKMKRRIDIGIVNYPDCLQSAVFGLQEMFVLASQLAQEQSVDMVFQCERVDFPWSACPDKTYTLILMPPSGPSTFYLQPDEALTSWLLEQHQQGCILASACAGAFILAKTGLLDHRSCTTHWGLEALFRRSFPAVDLKTEAILVNQGDVMTAGGVMSWLDLGFEVVARFATFSVLRQLGRELVIDVGSRQQRFYRIFMPDYQHGDRVVLAAQQYLTSHLAQSVGLKELAQEACLSERTLQRRFLKATGLGPNQYLQRLRIQQACDLLETSQQTFDAIAYAVGYQDAGSFRKLFIREMGLTPKAFREKFRR